MIFKDTVYLDHAATTLYAERQIDSVAQDFKNSIYGNPHSSHAPSDQVTKKIDQVRHRYLII